MDGPQGNFWAGPTRSRAHSSLLKRIAAIDFYGETRERAPRGNERWMDRSFFSPEIHHFAGKLSQMRINRERLPLACFLVHQPCSCVAELFKLGQCNGGRRHDSFPGLSLNSRENLLLLFDMISSVKTVSVEHISRYIRKLARVAISIYPCLVSLVVSTLRPPFHLPENQGSASLSALFICLPTRQFISSLPEIEMERQRRRRLRSLSCRLTN